MAKREACCANPRSSLTIRTMRYSPTSDFTVTAVGAAVNARPIHTQITSVLLVLVVLPDRPAAA